MTNTYRAFRTWIPFAVAITALCGLAYVAVQQNYRMSANDPQIQIAEDTAASLAGGAAPDSVAGSTTIDIERSLAPFVSVFSDEGRLVASTARLGGAKPVPPIGVLNAARVSGQNRVTWQPRRGVRIAAVVQHYQASQEGTASGGFVLAGRSLREIELRVDDLTRIVGVAWLGALAATLAVIWVSVAIETRGRPSSSGRDDRR